MDRRLPRQFVPGASSFSSGSSTRGVDPRPAARPRSPGTAQSKLVQLLDTPFGQSAEAPKPVLKNPSGQAWRSNGTSRTSSPSPSLERVARSCRMYRDLLPVPSSVARRAGPNDPEPTWHQVAELPELAANITDHQGQSRTCTAVATSMITKSPRRFALYHRATLGCGDVLSQRSSSHSRRAVEEIVRRSSMCRSRSARSLPSKRNECCAG